MSFDQLKANFNEILICKLHKGFTYTSCPISFKATKMDQPCLYWVEMDVPSGGKSGKSPQKGGAQ